MATSQKNEERVAYLLELQSQFGPGWVVELNQGAYSISIHGLTVAEVRAIARLLKGW